MTDSELIEKVFDRIFERDEYAVEEVLRFYDRVLVRYARLVERGRIHTVIAKSRQLNFRGYL